MLWMWYFAGHRESESGELCRPGRQWGRGSPCAWDRGRSPQPLGHRGIHQLPHHTFLLFSATYGLQWGRCSVRCCKQETVRTASGSPAGKEMVVNRCGRASGGPEDARWWPVYTRGVRGLSACLAVLPRSPGSETQGRLPE